MQAFEWVSPGTVEEAVKLLTPADPKMDHDAKPRPLGGGQDLLSTMKAYITTPARVVNLKMIQGMDGIASGADGLKIGGTATLAAIAEDEGIAKNFPGLSEAAQAIATPQIRNVATLGGNLCQRSRCWYYRLENFKCLKKGGDTCFAASGQNKYNAVIGGGPSFFVHPSDMAPMLITLGARVTLMGPGGKREMLLEDFFILPADATIRHENVLQDGEIVVGVSVPGSALAQRSHYLKFKERDSLDFALASVAAAVDLGADGTVREARMTLGGVAPKPWRAKEAEDFLKGKKLTDATLAEAGKIVFKDANPLEHNGFKVPLAQTLIRRAFLKLATT